MKLRELLQVGDLRRSKILTKEIGMDNEVTSAMILEALDIEHWSKKNQLILTSFYAFNGLTDEALELFFSKMQQMGVSGLVVKMDRFITMIPTQFISWCFQYKIPLIKISQDVSYEKVLLTIYEPLLNHQTHILRTYYEVRQRFTELDQRYSTLESIFEKFYSMIKAPCVLKLVDKKVEIQQGHPERNCIVLSRTSIHGGEFMKNNYSLLELYSQSSIKTHKAIEVPIFNDYSKNCVLLVYLKHDAVKETDLVIVENTIDVLREKLNTEYLLKKERYRRLNHLADAILQNTPATPDELDSLLIEADMNRYPSYQAVAFSTRSLAVEPLKENIVASLRTLRTHSIFFDQHNYSIVLFNFDPSAGEIEKQLVKKRLKKILDEYSELSFSISNVKTKYGIKEILMECLDILRFNENFYSDSIVTLADIGIFRYFIQKNQLQELQNLIPYLLQKMADTDYDLFETLYQFLRNKRNYKKTAEAMFLHSKTIRYRLQKIENFLAIDLSNPLQLINYELATYMIKMRRIADEKHNHFT